MQTEIVISGFGGQGVLFAGTVLAYAGMEVDKNVTWIPSYGPEMRGGTAHVTVIISDEEIGSPIVRRPGAALILNNPSMEKYSPLMKTDGVLVYNSSLASDIPKPYRTDIWYIAVPASEMATELGNVKMANMVGIGALVVATKMLPLAAVRRGMRMYLAEDKHELLAQNERALECGAHLVEPVMG